MSYKDEMSEGMLSKPCLRCRQGMPFQVFASASLQSAQPRHEQELH